MPLSDYDHIEALRQRLIRLKQIKQTELAEIDEAIHALSLTPKLLGTVAPRPVLSESPRIELRNCFCEIEPYNKEVI